MLFFSAIKLDINVKNGHGETALMIAVHQDQIDMVKILHKLGKSIIRSLVKQDKGIRQGCPLYAVKLNYISHYIIYLATITDTTTIYTYK